MAMTELGRLNRETILSVPALRVVNKEIAI